MNPFVAIGIGMMALRNGKKRKLPAPLIWDAKGAKKAIADEVSEGGDRNAISLRVARVLFPQRLWPADPADHKAAVMFARIRLCVDAALAKCSTPPEPSEDESAPEGEATPLAIGRPRLELRRFPRRPTDGPAARFFPADHRPAPGVFVPAGVMDMSELAFEALVNALTDRGKREEDARKAALRMVHGYLRLIESSPWNVRSREWLWLPGLNLAQLDSGVVTTLGVFWSDGTTQLIPPPVVLWGIE